VCFGKKPTAAAAAGNGGGGGQRGSPESVSDDPSIMRLYEQLYQEVHTWSSEFLADPAAHPLMTADETLIRHVVLVEDMSAILQDRSLRRKVIEGIVGYTISFLQARRGMQTFNYSKGRQF